MIKNILTTFLTGLTEAFASLYQRISKFFGGQSGKTPEPIKVNTDLCFAQSARRQQHYEKMALPEELLKAFADEALVAGDVRFIGREEQINRLLVANEMWRNGHGSMIVVTGSQGCGITSLLQQMDSRVDNHESWNYSKLTHRPQDNNDSLMQLCAIVGCKQPLESVDELLEYINSLPASVFMVDNGHFLTCRIMGGHNAIRVFGAVMVATQQRHLWILGCQEYAWRRLTYMYQADRYFTDHIELPFFSEAELSQCLAVRLQTSEIKLNEAIPNEPALMPAGLTSQLTANYKLSNGKPDLAFFYLLSSMSRNIENQLWDVQPAIVLDFNLLKQLISEELFTLAEVAAHGKMTIEDHQAIFRNSHDESWLLLERLYQQCLLDKNSSGNEPAYYIAPLYSDIIARHLTNANYLY